MSRSSTDLARLLYPDDLDDATPRVFEDDGIDLIELMPDARPQQPAAPVITEPDPAMLEQARADGFAAGAAEAETRLAEIRAQADRVLADALDAATAAATATQCLAREQAAARIAATLVAALGAVLPAAAAADAARSFACVLDAVAPMLAEPEMLRIRAHPDHADALARAIALLPEHRATVQVDADAREKPGDCRVEWTDGSARFDAQACWRAVVGALAEAGLRLPQLREINCIWPEDTHGAA